MQKIRKFNTMFERNEATEDKHDMKRHTRAMVFKILKRGKKNGEKATGNHR